MQALNLGVITIWLKYFKVYTLPFVDIDFSLGDDIDGIALKNYYDPNYKGDFVVSPLKAIANQSVGLYSLLGGTAGAIVGVFYFGIEAFYLGG